MDLVEVVDVAFRGWDPLELAIATDRLFAAEPVSVRTLANRMEADRDGLRRAQRAAEERMLDWLSSPAAAPFNAHLRALSDRLGVVATLDQLIAAHPQHADEVPQLQTPLWRVIVALLSDRRLQEGWLIRGDLRQLRDLTRRLLPDRPTVAEAAEMLRRIGIREETVPAWLAATPGLRVSKGRVEAPGAGHADEHGREGPQHAADPRFTGPAEGPPGDATPGGDAPGGTAPGSAAPAGTAPAGTAPVGTAPAGTAPGDAAPSGDQRPATSTGLPMRRPPKPYATGVGPPAPPMSAIRAASVAIGDGPPRPPIGDSPRCFRGTDGRWWHRIDVTTAHLQGGPVPVPEGYAGHLGLRPGGVLSVTGPGNDVLVIVWRDVPAFDSLRPLLRRLPAAAGDHVFVSISGCELEARKLASLGPQGGTIGPAERALRLIGYAPNSPAGPEEAVRIISQRVGANHDLGLDELIKRLRVRGDQDILSQLEAATARRV
ncbi:MAG: hypothetical protein GEV11_18345 [Streptosporangiales bacterium]|nr:hypothetical protein [Streptosporangiales bacterium]